MPHSPEWLGGQISLSLDAELNVALKNAAAQLGVPPATLARVAIRKQFQEVGFEDMDADRDPKLARKLKRRTAAAAARKAMAE